MKSCVTKYCIVLINVLHEVLHRIAKILLQFIASIVMHHILHHAHTILHHVVKNIFLLCSCCTKYCIVFHDQFVTARYRNETPITKTEETHSPGTCGYYATNMHPIVNTTNIQTLEHSIMPDTGPVSFIYIWSENSVPKCEAKLRMAEFDVQCQSLSIVSDCAAKHEAVRSGQKNNIVVL